MEQNIMLRNRPQVGRTPKGVRFDLEVKPFPAEDLKELSAWYRAAFNEWKSTSLLETMAAEGASSMDRAVLTDLLYAQVEDDPSKSCRSKSNLPYHAACNFNGHQWKWDDANGRLIANPKHGHSLYIGVDDDKVSIWVVVAIQIASQANEGKNMEQNNEYEVELRNIVNGLQVWVNDLNLGNVRFDHDLRPVPDDILLRNLERNRETYDAFDAAMEQAGYPV